MIKRLLYVVALVASLISHAQITTTTGTYSAGAQGVQRINPPVTNNSISTCADTLKITIPNGNYIYSVDIEYSILALNPVWMSDIVSYVAMPSHAKKEATIFNGTGNSAGTQAYTRSNLTFANGVVANGQLRFVLHAFRTFGPNGCNTTNASIVNNTFKVTVHHGPAPTCFPPLNPTVTWVMSNKARVAWTTGGATQWEIEYGAIGFTPGTGTIVAANTNPFTISGLSPSTSYTFYVRDVCSPTNKSVWSTGTNFSTLCTPINAVYTQNFDGSTWTTGTGTLNANNTIDPCWVRNPLPNGQPNGPYAWGTRTGATGTNNTGPSGDHTTGTGKYIYAEASNGNNQSVATIISPLVNLVPLNIPELEFYYHMFGNGIGTLNVDIWTNATGWQTIFTKSGQQQTSSTQAWIKESIPLFSYADDTVRVRFRAVHGPNAIGDIAVDDVKLKEGPTCPPPTNLTLLSLAPGNATINWTAASATTWDIQYGLFNFTFGTGTKITTSTKPYTATGLTGGAIYSFYVRERCSATDTSAWIGPIHVPIPCAPINAPFAENFNGTNFTSGNGIYNTGDALAPCFLRNPQAGTSAQSDYYWGMRTLAPTTGGTGPATDKTGTGRYAYTESSAGTQGQNATFILPTLNLAPLTNPELRFWYHMFGAGMGALSVDVYKVKGGLTSGVYIKTGQQTLNRNAPWQEAIVNLSAFSGDTIIIVFRGIRGVNQTSDMAIDEITVMNAPTCPIPSNLAASNIMSNSVQLSWTSGGASNWNIDFGPVGFTPGGAFTPASINPFTLSGLAPNTTYQVYVRDSCGIGDVSPWVGPITFTTGCALLAAPYSENFDSTNWVPNGTFTPGVIDNCWQRSSTTTYWWKPGTGATATVNSGPDFDHSTGTGKYIYTETNNGGVSTSITSPSIDLSPLTLPELTFWYHMYGALINKLDVQINNGSGWTTVATLTGQQQTSSADAWKKYAVNLSSYANDTVQVRFVAQRNAGNANTVDIAIDDVDIHELPSCPDPQNFAATNITSNAATLSWTTGGATNWNIAFGLVPFVPGASFISTTTNPTTLNGLLPNSAYHVYVRDSCGIGDVSNWVGPISIFTGCLPIAAPYVENFDGTSWQPFGTFAGGTIGSCWNRSDTAVYWWKSGTGITPTVNSGPDFDHTTGTGKYIYTETSNGGSVTTITSPAINLVPLNVPELTFWYHMYGSLINKLDVQINNGSGWTTVLTKTGQQQTSSTSPWQEAIIPLATYADDTIQVRFIATRNMGNNNRVDIAIDDLEIHEAPSCPKPLLVTATNATASSIQVSWTTGGATAWQIEYGPSGYAPGSGTIVSATTNPFTVSGLAPNTIYDLYVRDSCGVGSVSAWEGPAKDTTLCGVVAAPYFENFESATWLPTPGGFTAGAVDQCWDRSSSTQYWWRPGIGATPTPNTGPSGDHTTGLGKYIYTESNTGSTTTSIISPEIDLSPLNTPQLRFWYHMYGSLITNLIIQLNNGSGWVAVDTITGQQQTVQTALWKEQVVNLAMFADDTIQVRFIGNKVAGNINTADICIDDVRLIEAPTCLQPTNVQATTSTTTSVTLGWTSGGASNWQIEYGPVGFVPGNGTIVNAATNPFAVTGLSPSQQYQFYVRDSCGIGVVSFWTGPIQYSTLCGTVMAPYFENFDVDFDEGTGTLNDGSTISTCWTRNPDSAYHWGGGTGPTGTAGTGPNADHTSSFGSYVYVEASLTPNGSIATLETPLINLSAVASPEMHFWYHMWAANGTQGKLRWEVLSGNSWIKLDSMSGNQGNTWQEMVVDLSSYANQTIKIRFWAQKGNGPTPQQGDIAIDDLSIISAVNCAPPSNLVTSAATTNSIQLGWNAGSSTAWQIEYGPTGFTPGSGTIINTTTNPYIITGLAVDSTYDFYVRSDCSPFGYSSWAGPVTDSTLNCPPVTAAFTFAASGLTFNFDASSSSGSVTDYTWDFGDGTFGTGVNPIHTYAVGGNYNVTLIVENACGSADTSVQIAGPCVPISGTFTYTSNALAVTFTTSSITGTGLQFAWDFGDGTNSSVAAPAHTYGIDGIYNVVLIVTDACGNVDTLTASVTVCVALQANFSWVQSGLTLNFSAISPTAISWAWQFGDGSTDTGAATSHTYAQTGTYQVRLVVTNLCGQTADTIIFIPICVSPIASWTYTIISSSSSGMQVQFNGTASIGASTYEWDFGDGTSNNTSAIPVHTYNVAGLFWVVTLTITNNCGETNVLRASLAQIGIDEDFYQPWLLYPNPANDFAVIQLPPAMDGEMSVQITNAVGATVYKQNFIADHELILDIAKLPQGSYLVEVEHRGSISRQRLIIQR